MPGTFWEVNKYTVQISVASIAEISNELPEHTFDQHIAVKEQNQPTPTKEFKHASGILDAKHHILLEFTEDAIVN